MRFMRCSKRELDALPTFHYDVLLDMIQGEVRHAEHQRALAEVRAAQKRRRR